MAEQATQPSAAPVVVINPHKGLRIYLLASKGALEDGSEGTIHEKLQLVPGANRVPADRWKAFTKEVKQDLDKGVLKVMTKALNAYDEDAALALVKATIDRQLLKAFRVVDTRKAVRKAIDDQIADITGKKREESDEELDS
jgi:hypothetical protein